MAGIYCEGAGEFQRFPAEEFHDYRGVKVHAVGRWHLTNGDVIEMDGTDKPQLVDGCPVVAVGDLTAAEAESYEVTYGRFDVAPDADRGNDV